jgi:coproporphyrinogen III oxidase
MDAFEKAMKTHTGPARVRGSTRQGRHATKPSSSIIRPPRLHSSPRARSLTASATPGPSDTFEHYILETQRSIIAAAEALDASGIRFVHDRWERPSGSGNGGYGITSVLEDGAVLEKAAVNVSVISGVLSPERAKMMSSRGRHGVDPSGGQSYAAAAMSLVFHSAHPFIPTLRADVRLFEVDGRQWYGGGCDLTPFYLIEEDAAEFHAFWKTLCDQHGTTLYPQFKE